MAIMTRLLAEAENPMIAPSYVFGAIALAVFAILIVVCWSYRDVAHRQGHKAPADAADHAGAPGASRHGSGH